MPTKETGICRNCSGQIDQCAGSQREARQPIGLGNQCEPDQLASHLRAPSSRFRNMSAVRAEHFSDAQKGQEKGKVSAYPADSSPTYRKHWPCPSGPLVREQEIRFRKRSLNTGCKMAAFTGRHDQRDIRLYCRYLKCAPQPESISSCPLYT